MSLKKKYYRTYVFAVQLSGGIHYYAGKRASVFENAKEDNYKGSGTVIRRAFKKYGYDMYISREWQDHESEELMCEFEELLVDECKEKYGERCINIASGGQGGNLLKYASEEKRMKTFAKLSRSLRGKKLSDETRIKMSKAQRRPKSQETRNKISQNMKRIATGRMLSETTKARISASLKTHYETTGRVKSKPVKNIPRHRVTPVWGDGLYQTIWREWNDTLDTNNERLKYGKFSSHLSKVGIYTGAATDIQNLINHFNRVLSGNDKLHHS